MAARKVTDAQLAALFAEHRSPTKIANTCGMSVRAVIVRLRKIGIGPVDRQAVFNARNPGKLSTATGRIDKEVYNGTVLVFSDAHYYPGEPSTAHRALRYFIQELKPDGVICNGDAVDGARISRHPRIGWDNKPTVIQELTVVGERLGELRDDMLAANKLAWAVWTMGNHDARFETYLAVAASQYESVKGFSLKDHFPEWEPCWGLWLNDDVVVKHRWNGGATAARKNTINSGKTIVTGHTHSMNVAPFNDYKGVRWGVDTGTLAAPYGEQFADYTEINPVDWRSGFAVLTFWNGELLWPELVYVMDEEAGLVQFRGVVYEV